MKNNQTRGQWAGSSHLKERYDELKKAHEEFQKLLDSGFQITAAKKVKRPRIQKAKTPREVEVAIFGGKVRMTFAEYQQRGQGLKVVMEIF
jgi:hypothetical protein